MNYRKIYFNIIERRKHEAYDGYTEVHHILPRSLGGSNDKTNLVALSAREHFICHLLLTKMYEENSIEWRKMVKAFVMMRAECKYQKRYITSKRYKKLKESFCKIQSQYQSGAGNSQYGTMWIHSTELRQCKKIKKNDALPDGWQIGRVLDFDAHQNKLKIKPEKQQIERQLDPDKVKHFKQYYVLYVKFGFNEFVKITGYPLTQSNLVRMFYRYVPEFVAYEKGKNKKKN